MTTPQLQRLSAPRLFVYLIAVGITATFALARGRPLSRPAQPASLADFQLPDDASWYEWDRGAGAPGVPHWYEDGDGRHHLAGYPEAVMEAQGDKRRALLRQLFHAFHAFAEEHGVVYWLAHGTLLGQAWGGKIMTHDSDLDTTLSALHALHAADHAMWDDRYMLDVNPRYRTRASLDGVWSPDRASRHLEPNAIDARFIDTATGLFIDITALATPDTAMRGRPSVREPAVIGAGPGTHRDASTQQAEWARLADARHAIVQDKSVHVYYLRDLLPLRPCAFEGVPAWCPRNRACVLADEYPDYASAHHGTWRWDAARGAFAPLHVVELVDMVVRPTARNCDAWCARVVARPREVRLVVNGSHEAIMQIRFLDGEREIVEYRALQRGDQEEAALLRQAATARVLGATKLPKRVPSDTPWDESCQDMLA